MKDLKKILDEEGIDGVKRYLREKFGDKADDIIEQIEKKLGKEETDNAIKVPGRVQSRINISNDGWDHVLKEHYSNKNKSQFTISQEELRSLLSSKEIVNTTVSRTLESADGIRYVREVTLEKTWT